MNFKKFLSFGLIAGLFAVGNISASEKSPQNITKLSFGVTFNLGKRTALITGGTSGIGRATAKLLLKSNCNVVIVGSDPKKSTVADELNKECAEECAKTGVKCLYKNGDVSKEEDVKEMVTFTVNNFGSLDFLVCSAGIGGENNTIADENINNWNKINGIDYTGVMLCNKYGIEQMRKQGKGGSVVNVASMFGLVAVPSNVAYSGAKGGVVNMTRAAGTAYASEGIRVNCVCPGVIDTPLVPDDQKDIYANIHPMKRIGTPDETSYPIVFLLSDGASFITGANIAMDGGYTAV